MNDENNIIRTMSSDEAIKRINKCLKSRGYIKNKEVSREYTINSPEDIYAFDIAINALRAFSRSNDDICTLYHKPTYTKIQEVKQEAYKECLEIIQKHAQEDK